MLRRLIIHAANGEKSPLTRTGRATLETPGAGTRSQARRGQSLIELSLLLPLLLWVGVGVVDFGRVYYYDNVAINAARSGARLAADSSRDDAAIRAAVRADAGSSISLPDASIVISPSPTRSAGGDVTVSVTYSFAPLTPLVDRVVGSTLTVTRRATMVVMY